MQPLNYSLKSDPIIDLLGLQRACYDTPLFFHPPLFVYSLALLIKLTGLKLILFFPILAMLFSIWLTFLIGRILYSERVALIAAGILALCPIALHASTKIWIDAPLTMFCTATIYLLTTKRYGWAGAAYGLALLTKLPAIGIAPVVLFLLAKDLKRSWRFIVPAVMIAAPWYVVYYFSCNSFVPTWLHNNPGPGGWFANETMARPAIFYVSNLLVVAPVYMFGFIEMGKRRNWICIIWVVCFIAMFMLQKLLTPYFGFIMRYLLPCLPGLALLSAKFLEQKKKFWIPAVVMCGYGVFLGITNIYIFYNADVFNLKFLLKLCQ